MQLGRRSPGAEMPDAVHEPGFEMAGAEQLSSVRAGSAFETTVPAAISSPLASAHAGDPVALERDARDRAAGAHRRAAARGAAAASASVTAPMPPSGSARPAGGALAWPLSRCSSVEHGVVRARAEIRAEHGVQRERALEQRGLEGLLEHVDRC